MAEACELSVVIPVHDEERIVEEACRELVARLEERGLAFEVLLSENGSRDGTRRILERLSGEDPRLRYLTADAANYGRALRLGILAARGRYVVADEIDLCDLAFYDRALPMLRRGEADMVVGSKRAPGAEDRRPAYRRLATWAHNSLLRVALGFEGTDTHGVKAMVRTSLAPVAARCVVEGDVFASELVLRAAREGCRVTEIPVALRERRPPTIGLMRRVPRVLGQVARLILVLRLRPPARRPAASEAEEP
ncbi:MAG TPA: glycosyltransferase family 2 protein [Anaeromyxobacteraceae bacterium]|nr:glycosyltransferase family 2 protein [Anaeromyxobacteraceae bacterium]